MSQVNILIDPVLTSVQARLPLTEVPGEQSQAHLPLHSPHGPLGALRLWQGEAGERLVTIGLAVPPAGIESRSLFVFMPPESALPHLLLEVSRLAPPGVSPHYTLVLDLLPRLDLAANLAYVDAVYTPLTAAHEAVTALAGLSPAPLSLRQAALMSPWRLVLGANDDSFARLAEAVSAYTTHWLALVRDGLPGLTDDLARSLPAAGLAQRDQRHRAALFDPDVDPMWARLDELLGAATGARLRGILSGAAAGG